MGIFRIQMGPELKIRKSEVNLAPLFQKLCQTMVKNFRSRLIANLRYSNFSVAIYNLLRFFFILEPFLDATPNKISNAEFYT